MEKALKERFKNMRRSFRTGLEFTPGRKGKSLNHRWSADSSSRMLDDVTYKHHKSCLLKNYSTSKGILRLMNDTAGNRRQWIQDKRPTVDIILKELPCLKSYDVVCIIEHVLLIMIQLYYFYS